MIGTYNDRYHWKLFLGFGVPACIVFGALENTYEPWPMQIQVLVLAVLGGALLRATSEESRDHRPTPPKSASPHLIEGKAGKALDDRVW